jgi:hypothetical protein
MSVVQRRKFNFKFNLSNNKVCKDIIKIIYVQVSLLSYCNLLLISSEDMNEYFVNKYSMQFLGQNSKQHYSLKKFDVESYFWFAKTLHKLAHCINTFWDDNIILWWWGEYPSLWTWLIWYSPRPKTLIIKEIFI